MTTETITPAPPRIGIGEPFRPAQAAGAGTIIVREAVPFGTRAVFATKTPCCGEPARVDAVKWGSAGFPHICRACGWCWLVFLADEAGQRIGDVTPGTVHPRIGADRAEWVSRGFGREPGRARRRW